MIDRAGHSIPTFCTPVPRRLRHHGTRVRVGQGSLVQRTLVEPRLAQQLWKAVCPLRAMTTVTTVKCVSGKALCRLFQQGA